MKQRDSVPASRDRVSAALDLHRYPEALAEAEKLVALDPDNAESYAWLARACLEMKLAPRAQAAAEKGLSLEPTSEWLHRLRAWSLLGQGRKWRVREALASVEDGLRVDAESAESHCLRGRILAALGRRQEGVAAIHHAIEIDPENAEFHFLLGCPYLDWIQLTEAELHFREAIRLDPRHVYAINNLGAVLMRRNRPAEAAKLFKEVVLIDPTLKMAKYNTETAVRQSVGLPEGQSGTGVKYWFRWLMVTPYRAFSFLPVIVWHYTWGRRRAEQRLTELQAEDPLLPKVFEKIDDDRRKGFL